MGDYMEDYQCNHKSFDLYYIINTIPCVHSHALTYYIEQPFIK